MKDLNYVLRNFFTHKDFLAPADQIPGTMFTPLHFLYIVSLLTLIFSSAIYVSHRKKLIKPCLASVWAVMVIWEFLIIGFDNFAGKAVGFDFKTSLSLYHCSIYLYTMPFILWGKGNVKQACCGYLCTLGLLGALINLIFPATRLFDYSCISFAGMHTTLFHGAMFFSFLVLIFSGYHHYDCATTRLGLLLPSVPSLILSIPATIVNLTIGSDYMYLTGQFPAVAKIFGNTRPIIITLTLYMLYIIVPALFYLHGYLHNRKEDPEAVSLYLDFI